jgi:hypothetical protein
MGKMAGMTSKPPTEPLSRTTRLIAAVLIALVALGITSLVARWLAQSPHRESAPQSTI